MSDLTDGFKVSDDHHRVGRRLDKDHLAVLFDRGFDIKWIRCVDKLKLDVVIRQYFCKEPCRSSVGVVRNDDMFARFDEFQCSVDRRHARCEGKPETSSLECCDVS